MADQENKVVWQDPEAGTIVPVASHVDFHVQLPWPDDYLIYPSLLEGLFGNGIFDPAAVIETNAGLPTGDNTADGRGGGVFITGNRAATVRSTYGSIGAIFSYWTVVQNAPPSIIRQLVSAGATNVSFRGVIYAGGSYVVALPFDSYMATQMVTVARLNITSGAMNALELGMSYNAVGRSAFMGGVYIGNGKVVAIPYGARRFLLIDTIQNTVTEFGPDLGIQSGKFYGGIYVGNGKLVAIPHNAPQVVLVDVNEMTVTPFGDVDESSMKYAGGIYLDHGRIAAIPYNSPYVMHIDTHAQVTRKIIDVDVPEPNKYSGGVYIGDERFIWGRQPFCRQFAKQQYRSPYS